MADNGTPGVPTNGAVPPWAVVGMQLLDALVSRLREDPRDADARAMRSPDDAAPDGPPRRPPPLDARRLARSCRILARRNERLARALGACRCWGRNPDCARCGGRGRPGALDVDPAAFAEIVLPLLQAQPELFLRHVQPEVEVVPTRPRTPPAPEPSEDPGPGDDDAQ